MNKKYTFDGLEAGTYKVGEKCSLKNIVGNTITLNSDCHGGIWKDTEGTVIAMNIRSTQDLINQLLWPIKKITVDELCLEPYVEVTTTTLIEYPFDGEEYAEYTTEARQNYAAMMNDIPVTYRDYDNIKLWADIYNHIIWSDYLHSEGPIRDICKQFLKYNNQGEMFNGEFKADHKMFTSDEYFGLGIAIRQCISDADGTHFNAEKQIRRYINKCEDKISLAPTSSRACLTIAATLVDGELGLKRQSSYSYKKGKKDAIYDGSIFRMN